LTVSGGRISPPIVINLTTTGSGWTGIVGKIPAGTGLRFQTVAYDAADAVLYQGEAVLDVPAGQTVSLRITMQQAAIPSAYNNNIPVIDSVIATATEVAPGDQITLTAAGHDVDTGNILYWTWSGNGTFGSASSATTTWKAPTQEGAYNILIRLMDNKGGFSIAALSIMVSSHAGRGTAAVNVAFNTWPQVTNVAAQPAHLTYPTTATVTATAQDTDGDALSYEWTDNCQGSFVDNHANPATWMPPSSVPTSNACVLSVSVTDGRSGQGTGSVTVEVGVTHDFGLAPTIVSTEQSETEVALGDTVRFAVEAKDPEGTLVSFTWSCSAGTMGASEREDNASGSTTSRTTWTPPTSGGTSTVTVVLRDAAGQETTKTFSVAVLMVDQYALGVNSAIAVPSCQSATMGRTGQLVAMEFAIARESSAIYDESDRLILTASSAIPNSTAATLGQASLSLGAVPVNSMGPYSPLLLQSHGPSYFVFSQPVAVTQGQILYFCLSSYSVFPETSPCPEAPESGFDCVSDGNGHWVEPVFLGGNHDAYSGGRLIAPGSLPDVDDGYDLAFKTYVR
jgi:hypothetical protein